MRTNVYRYLLLLLLVPYSNDAFSSDKKIQTKEERTSAYSNLVGKRLMPFEQTYLLSQNWTDDDDDSIEFQFSSKWVITNPDCSRHRTADCSPWEFYLAYTGKFDFYFGTRPSDPVINRVSNPAVHTRYHFYENWGEELSSDTASLGLRYLDVALQHYSNGQTREADTQRVQELARAIYARNPGDPFFDNISRGFHFISVEAALRILQRPGDFIDAGTGECLSTRLLSCWDLKLRINPVYFSDSDPVTWGPYEGENRVSNYSRGRITLQKTLRRNSNRHEPIQFTAEWFVGDDFLRTDSLDVSVLWPVRLEPVFPGITLPLFAKCHFGPLNNLSDYTFRQNSCGLGLRFF